MGSGRVLIIDDKPESAVNIRDALHHALEGEIQVVTDADTALSELEHRLPDLILINSDLAGRNGLEFCRWLKFDESFRDIPVLLIVNSSDQMGIGFDNGAEDCIIHPLDAGEIVCRVRHALNRRQSGRSEATWVADPIADEPDNESLMGVRRLQAEVDEHRYMNERLHYRATHDFVTHLYNRTALEQEVIAVQARVRSCQTKASFIALEINQFRLINEGYGHVAGDELLRHVAELIASACSNQMFLARTGGAKFGLLCMETTLEAATLSAEEIEEAVSEVLFEWENQQFEISLTIVVIEITEEISSFDQLILIADELGFTARKEGRRRIQVYQGDTDATDAEADFDPWETRLLNALRKNHFRIWFQKIQRLKLRSPKNDVVFADYSAPEVKIETLVRLFDPDTGQLLLPAQFMPAAHRLNMVHIIDRWMFNSVVDFLANNRFLLDQMQSISINLSATSIRDEFFADYILDELQARRIPPKIICFEVTESESIDVYSARIFMNKLSEAGCVFALDDFGSGFSSFRYLSELPFDMVKLEGVFVREMGRNPSYLSLVKSIVQTAHKLEKQVIAEFVENESIERELATLGVEWGQGYHCHIPEELTQAAVSAPLRRAAP